ncbi:DAK2 domain-containing protein [Listeria booriae]|uniref:DAK2 domain-containing protein n=1 Tax=Listeria booriae TaxID=1552123 RepID=A0A7X0ZVA1_9LIST|nr:DAK2 domain-containing protein [Listeria booriae]MBC2285119.1 DAK2 domain-containing protein [Listeria booriae]MBC2294547.1 DAK2 domain-containing protein [Listeria booriae]MBC2311145.1 DAK2 domain-containing protein [Listeria booriae]
MGMYQLNGEKLAAMIAAGAENLAKNADFVDSLNVFPVPDGDTGTNMNLSMTSGAQEVGRNSLTTVGTVGASLAKGLLMGARGNSGVILSQLFRGFSKAIEGKTELNTKEFAAAFTAGVETAYKAVMKPVEGTILTVAREAAKAGAIAANESEDIEFVMQQILEKGKIVLAKTQEMLPVLKEVGVVDSGGQGLIIIYEGFYAALTGKEEGMTNYTASMGELINAEHHRHVQDFMSTEDIVYGYCTEIMVQINENKTGQKKFNEEQFRDDLAEMGDSLLVVADDEVAKVHVHTEYPGNVLNYGQQYGSLIKLKIENMREQHREVVKDKPAEVSEKAVYGIVTVSVGDGIKRLFESVGATVVLSGGQTMNPSTEDIVKAIESANAEQVFVLPNNKNIQMAADQAALILGDDKVKIIPTKTIPQGLAALLVFQAEASFENNANEMIAAIQDVSSGQVTTAVRDTTVEGVTIKKDDYIGIVEGDIKISNPSLEATTVATLTKMLDDYSEIVTLLYGADVTEADAEKIAEEVSNQFPDIEFEIHSGGQPVYPYIFSVE